jgi:hypothetical protein
MKNSINLEKFKPKARRCSHCRELIELEPKEPSRKLCKVFGWIIPLTLARQQAVCKE